MLRKGQFNQMARRQAKGTGAPLRTLDVPHSRAGAEPPIGMTKRPLVTLYEVDPDIVVEVPDPSQSVGAGDRRLFDRTRRLARHDAPARMASADENKGHAYNFTRRTPSHKAVVVGGVKLRTRS